MSNWFKSRQYLTWKLQDTKTLKDSETIERYIMGATGDAETCSALIKKLYWITYHKDIWWLSKRTDNLWGCMHRVGQMLVAELLTRYAQRKQVNISESYIIDSFNDNTIESPYCLKHLFGEGIQEGQYSTPFQTFNALSRIHAKNPLKGFEGLKIFVQQLVLRFEKIVESMGFQICREHDKVVCELCGNKEKWNGNHASVVVIGQLTSQRQCILQMMKLKAFAGMMSGVGQRAHYYVGYQLDYKSPKNVLLFCLDPHKLQAQTLPKHFHCSEVRVEEINKLSNNVGICFYFGSPEEVQDLYDRLLALKVQCGNDLPFGVQLKEGEAPAHFKQLASEVTVGTEEFEDVDKVAERHNRDFREAYEGLDDPPHQPFD